MNAAVTPWSTTMELDAIARWLRGGGHVALLTHVKPDGDAIGSTLAVARALNAAAGRTVATCFYSGPMPTWHSDFIPANERTLVGELGPNDLAPFNKILISDTGSWTQLDYAKPALKPRTADTAVIDHHLQGNADVSARRHIDTTSAAVCQPAAELCRLLLGLPSISKLPADIAEPLYFGLATDTGWFRHSNVSPAVMDCAAELLRAGVNPARLYTLSEQRDRAARILLMGRGLAGMHLSHDGRLAIAVLTQQDFDAAGAEHGDVHGFTDPMLAIATVEIAVVLTEVEGEPNPVTKASFRSKTTVKTADVNLLAQRFGGGGHKQAAGARVLAPPAKALELVRAAAAEALDA